MNCRQRRAISLLDVVSISSIIIRPCRCGVATPRPLFLSLPVVLCMPEQHPLFAALSLHPIRLLLSGTRDKRIRAVACESPRCSYFYALTSHPPRNDTNFLLFLLFSPHISLSRKVNNISTFHPAPKLSYSSSPYSVAQYFVFYQKRADGYTRHSDGEVAEASTSLPSCGDMCDYLSISDTVPCSF